MSQPCLHDQLVDLFSSKDASLCAKILNHPDFQEFQKNHLLSIPSELFSRCFIHSSFAHEYRLEDQEVMEFLGDSVLQLILTDELLRIYSDQPEGKLSKLRSSVVNEAILAQLARAIGLNSLILVGRGEFTRKLQEQDTVLADTFEALLGLIYRFHGLSFSSKWVLDLIKEHLPGALDLTKLETFDAKSKLQEASLAKYKKLPVYTAENVAGGFEIKLWINDLFVNSGIFSSKKNGEKELAAKALKEKII